jgi:hypothetical protein
VISRFPDFQSPDHPITKSPDLRNAFRQKLNRIPSWISRFWNAEVKPRGWLGDSRLVPCTLNVVNPGWKPNPGPTSLFTVP